MKVELEIPDFQEYYFGDEDVSAEDLTTAIVNDVIHKVAGRVFDSINKFSLDDLAEKEIRELVGKNKEIIVNRVVDNVTKEVLRKRDIVRQMPRTKDIDDEWKEYFETMVDKAIAKKFR